MVTGRPISNSTMQSPVKEEARAPSTTGSEEKAGVIASGEWKPDKQIWLVIVGQIVVAFLPALDSTILVLALPVSSTDECLSTTIVTDLTLP